jgi:hypothetical protein
MANVKMPKFKAAQERAETPDLSDAGTDVKAVLVDTALYTFDATDEFLSDVSAAVVATSGNLANKAVSATDGTFSADAVTFTAVTGASIEAMYLYYDTGVAATSPLIAWIDSGAGGLPVTPNGTDITVTWNASGIYTP